MMMNPTLITRRRLLIAMALSPLLWQMRGAQAADVDPQRVVALEWLPAELLLALAVGLRTGRALRWVAGVNLATQLGLNLALEVFTYCNGALAGVMAILALPVYLAAEVAVTLVELRIYRRKLTGERGLSGRRITAYTWTANLCSFLAGVLLSFQLPTLF